MEIQKSLESLFELQGVRGAILLDDKGQLLRSKAHAIYDPDTLRFAAQWVSKVIEIQQGEWASLQAQFSEGKLILRSVGRHCLCVVADNTTNIAFLNVAINVTAKKIAQQAQVGAIQASASAPAVASVSDPGLSVSGLSSSGLSASGSHVAVAMDGEVSAFVDRCIKALAKSVGPMAKVQVKEVIRALAKGGRLTREQLPQLARAIEERVPAGDRDTFRSRIGG